MDTKDISIVIYSQQNKLFGVNSLRMWHTHPQKVQILDMQEWWTGFLPGIINQPTNIKIQLKKFNHEPKNQQLFREHWCHIRNKFS